MKKGLIFATTLAMALGVGAAVGAQQAKAAKVGAASKGDVLTFYLDISSVTWWNDGMGTVKLQTWNGSADVQYDGTWLSSTLFRAKDIQTADNWAGFKFVCQPGSGSAWDFSSWCTDFSTRYFTHGGDGTAGTWSDTEPSLDTVSVTVYVDGEKRGVEEVSKGKVPATPALTYGKSFSGWFSNAELTGEEVTAINEDTTVYGEVNSVAPATYGLNLSKVSALFEHPYLYAWDAGGENAGWPGVAIEGDTFIVPADAKVIIANSEDGESADKQTVDIALSEVENDVLRVLNEVVSGSKYNAVWESAVDEPAEDGYYIVGTKSGWKFAGATKMGAGEDGNLAQLLGYEGSAGEKFKVRSFFDGNAAWIGESDYEVGESDKLLDVYVNQYGQQYVEDHKEPAVQYDYKMQIVGKEGLVTLVQSEVEGKENEYWLPAEFHFEVGESVKFFRVHEEDSSVIAAGPKEDGLLTKVYVSDAENHVLSFAQEFTGKLMLDISTGKVWADQFTPGYYLAGVDGEWNPKLAMPAEKEAEGDSYAVLNLALAAGSAIKFINAPVEGNEFDWINAYEDKVGSETAVKFTVDGDNNLVVTKAGTYNVYYNPTTGWYGIEDTNPDIPAEEGYYICGEFSGNDCWRFDPNGKMTETSEGGNVAYTMSFSLGVGDEMEVRSYFNDQEPKDRHAILGNVIDLEDEDRLFDKNGEHIVARVAGVYDVYAKYEDRDGNPENGTEAFVYYVAEHVDSYKVTMVGVKFAGAAQEGTFALADQLAYVTEPFAPVVHSQDGYVIRGVYTDADCAEEHKYTSTVLDAATTLYVKYTKVGYYVIFGASDYSIDGAMLMNTAGIAGTNKAEAYLPGLKIGDTFSCVYYDGGYSGQDGIGTGADAYAEYEDSHVKMTVAGSYAVYFGKDNLVYLNAGLVAFLTNFISETGKECKLDETDHVITDVDALADVWKAQAKIYATLSEEEQGRIKTPDPEDPAKTLIDEFTARYEYIVNKYGTAKFNDFIWSRNIEVADPAYTMSMSAAENSSLIIVISAIAATSALALGALLLIKKRKHQ